VRVAIVAVGLAIASTVSCGIGDAWAQADAPALLDFGIPCQNPVEDLPKLDVGHVRPKSKPGTPMTAPDYPRESRMLGEGGTAVVRLLVTESGAVSQAQISKSTGYPRLDAAALEATRTWQLRPGTLEGKSRCMWGRFAITFNIEEHLAEELAALVPEARPFASALLRSGQVVGLLSWPDQEMKLQTLECTLRPIERALKRKDAADVFVNGVLADKYRDVIAGYVDTVMPYCTCVFDHMKKVEKVSAAPTDGKIAACGLPPSFE
jgi:TonB family protein